MICACTICGAAVAWPGRSDSNAVCEGCLPNLAQSLDRRTQPDAPGSRPEPALVLDLETVRQLLEEEGEPL